MKNKILIGVLIIIFLMANICVVKAYSGELDSNGYIILPDSIKISNGIGTGTIGLSSEANNYSIAYQKVDITKSQFDEIEKVGQEAKDYMSESSESLKQKSEEVNLLKSEYESLQSSSSATTEEKTEAYNKYNEANTELNELYETVTSKIQEYQNNYYSLIPEYTDSWQETTNTTDNVTLDFKNYTGTVIFVLWVKITNGTNTYYNAGYYSSIIENNQNTSDENTNTEGQDGKWTDFSNAKFSLVKDGISGAIVEATGVVPNTNNTYYLYITDNANKPNVSELSSDEAIIFSYNNESKKFIANDEIISGKVELNQDLYAVVAEYNNTTSEKEIVSYGTKLSRYAEAKYYDAFFATFMTNDADQIVTNFTHAKENNRKIEIKIGKISSNEILNKIKNMDASGFSDLLNFAKTNSSIFDETLDADKDDSYAIEYNANSSSGENKVLDLKGLEDGSYYYLYIKTDDENGKYISNEAVTLAQASTYENGNWYLFFYGSSDFKWSDFTSSNVDNTTANGVLPQTGASYIILMVLFVLGLLGVIAGIKYRKNNF